jgi:hypothetical protein
MAKPSSDVNQADSQLASSEGTAAYDDIETLATLNNPEDINLDGLPPQPTVQYSHLSTHESLYALAEQHKRYAEGMNEATLAARLISNLFIFADVPDPDDAGRSVVPCQTLELPDAFTEFDRFNKSLYSYVRRPRKRGAIQPCESELRYHSDLTIMAYKNAVSCRLRDECGDYPGVQDSYNAIAPFVSAEFKSDASPASQREATHQIAISSYISLVERQRLRRLRPDPISYTQDKNMRHYAYTICGTKVMLWVTRLQIETMRSRSYTTYKVQLLRVLELRIEADLKEFLEWHRRIVTWGLGVYVGSYVQDLENTMGAPGRESLQSMIITEKEVTAPVQDLENTMGAPGKESLQCMILTEKEVTAPVQSMNFGESAEQDETEQETEEATEQTDTEQAETEQEETEQATEQTDTEEAEIEQVDKRPLSLQLPPQNRTNLKLSRPGIPRPRELPSAPPGGSSTFHNRFHYTLCCMPLIADQISTGSSAFRPVSTPSFTQSRIPIPTFRTSLGQGKSSTSKGGSVQR